MFWIVQRIIPHYRRDFFEAVERSVGNVIVIHSSTESSDGLVDNLEYNFKNRPVRLIETPLGYSQCLVRDFLKEKPKVVVLGLELKILSNFIVWLLAPFVGAKVVWWTHGYNVHLRGDSLHFRIDRTIKTFMMKHCYRILLYTDYNQTEMLERGINRSKIIIVNNALNESPIIDGYNRVANEKIAAINASTKKASLTLTFIGRLVAAKKVEDVLYLALSLKKKIPDVRFFIIGDGDQREYLEEKIQQLNLQDTVIFTGTINDPNELAPYMRLTDFIVYTGSVGLAIVHSFIYGIPFLAMDGEPHSPEIAYLESNKNGYLAKSLDDMTEWIIKSHDDPEHIVRMNEYCRSVIRDKVNLSQMVENYVTVFFEGC